MIKVTADCIDAKYDEEIGVLMIFANLRESGVQRVITFSRFEIPFMGKIPTPDEEMMKTAELWKGKPFFFEMYDDPNRDQGDGKGKDGGMSDEEYFMHEKVFMGDIGAKMWNMAEHMGSDEWIMKMKKEKLMDKENEIRNKIQ